MLKNELSGFSIGNKVVKDSCVDPAHAWKIGCDREENGHVADGRWDESHFSQINTNRYNTTLLLARLPCVSNPCVSNIWPE